MAAMIKKERGWTALTDPNYQEPTQEEDDSDQDVPTDSPDVLFFPFNRCFIFCFFISSTPCICTTVLFSEVGYGEIVYEFADKYDWLSMYVLLGGFCFCLLCYSMDFYNPPHINKFCTFFENDTVLPTAVFVIKTVIVLFYGCLDIRKHPMIPFVLTALLNPLLLMLVHSKFISQGSAKSVMVKTQTMGTRVPGISRQSRVFWAAGMSSSIITGMVVVLVWVSWILSNDAHIKEIFATAKDDDEYIRWAAPGIAAFSNICTGFVISLKVNIAENYDKAAQHIGEVTVLLSKLRRQDARRDAADVAEFKSWLESGETAKDGTMLAGREVQEEWAKWKVQKDMFMRTVARAFQCAGCMILLMGGAVHVYAALVSASGQFASVFLTLMTVCFMGVLAVLASMCYSLSGIGWKWLQELPVWRMAVAFADTAFAKAMIVCIVLPAVPFLLALSFVNQAVRRRRRIYPRMSFARAPMSLRELRTAKRSHCDEKEAKLEFAPAPGDQWITSRVRKVLLYARPWDWVVILLQAYILAFGFTCYTLCPRLLNLVLAYVISILAEMPFGMVIVATFCCGIMCFLLPPVPGIPVYLFTGIVVAGTCPMGFEIGCGIAIAVSYFMKLLACAIQQVGIGGGLGRSLWIKAQVGVNKPLIRAIEVVLRRPGISIAKVAIACGGPDWPTSVLAGLMGISLLNMEMATIPVVFFVGPCTLSGAFYLRKEESEAWSKYATLMLNFTVATALMQQFVAAWSIQEVFETENAKVSKPLHKNIDLDWIDFKSQELRTAFRVRWKHLNCLMKLIFILGLLIEVGVAHLFYWRSTDCFGEFAVSDPISSVKLFGDGALFKMPALAGLGACCIGFFFFGIVYCHVRMLRAPQVQRRTDELVTYEKAWREARMRLARQARKEWPPPVVISSQDGVDPE